MEDPAGLEEGKEAGGFRAVDEAAYLAAQQQLGAGAGGVVLHLEPSGLVDQERHAGNLGFDDGADRGMEDLAGVVAIEAPERIEDAGDEQLERNGSTPRQQAAALEEPRRAEQPQLNRLGRQKGLDAEAEHVRREGGAQPGEVGAAEQVSATGGPHAEDL